MPLAEHSTDAGSRTQRCTCVACRGGARVDARSGRSMPMGAMGICWSWTAGMDIWLLAKGPAAEKGPVAAGGTGTMGAAGGLLNGMPLLTKGAVGAGSCAPKSCAPLPLAMGPAPLKGRYAEL